jgi:tetratricopeptide (TPR) repeat protein
MIRMRYFTWLIVLCAAFCLTPATSFASTMTLQTANDLFAAGNAFYRSQNYEEAREAYRQLVEAGYGSAPVLYNLGTVNARLGNTTTATAYLMKAKKVRPRDENIRANLAFVAPPPATDADGSVDPATAESVWSRFTSYLTAEEWLAMVWVALMLICVGAAGLLLVRSGRFSVVAKVMVWTGAVLIILVAAPAATQYYRTRIATRAMVLSAAELLSGPAERFTRVSNLTEGQMVRDLGEAPSGFRHVRLENGLQGYVHSSRLMPI